MKSLHLLRQQFGAAAHVTREQLKNIIGGTIPGAVFCQSNCITDVDCPVNYYCAIVTVSSGESCWMCMPPDDAA